MMRETIEEQRKSSKEEREIDLFSYCNLGRIFQELNNIFIVRLFTGVFLAFSFYFRHIV